MCDLRGICVFVACVVFVCEWLVWHLCVSDLRGMCVCVCVACVAFVCVRVLRGICAFVASLAFFVWLSWHLCVCVLRGICVFVTCVAIAWRLRDHDSRGFSVCMARATFLCVWLAWRFRVCGLHDIYVSVD